MLNVENEGEDVKQLPINSKNTLDIVRRVPRGIKYDDTVGCDQINSNPTGFGGD